MNWRKRMLCCMLATTFLCGTPLTFANAFDDEFIGDVSVVDPDDSYTSYEPVDPIDPVDPVDVVDPGDWSDTIDPDDIIVPSDPSDPSNPNDPIVTPNDPTDPNSPSNPPSGPEAPLSLSGDMTLEAGSVGAITANREVTWSVQSTGSIIVVVEISEGPSVVCQVSAIGVGTATIVARSPDGQEQTCTIKVVNSNSPYTNSGNGNSIVVGTSGMSSSSLAQIARISLLPTLMQKYTLPKHVSKNFAMTFASTLGKQTDNILDLLYTYDCYGTFFIDPKKIYSQDDRIRRIIGEGHMIGIELDEKSSSTPARALKTVERANERLSVVCGMPTRLVTVEGGSKKLDRSVYLALTQNGYRVWDWDYYVDEDALGVQDASAKLQEALDTKKRMVARFESSKRTVQALQETLGFVLYAQIPTQALSVSDKPVSHRKKS